MKTKQLFVASLLASATLYSCGGGEKEKTEEVKAVDTTAKTEAPKEEKVSITNPFPELGGKPSGAVTGGFAFVDVDIFNPGNKDSKFDEINHTLILAEVKEATDAYTRVQPFSDVCDVPNYLAVGIPQGQTAKKGDIVLAPWHHGESMMRAVVIDDKDPAQPIVNFIDVDWDNPAKGDKGVGYGQEQTQLRANTFYVISAPFTPGTTVAIKEGEEWLESTVIFANDTEALVKNAIGKVVKVNKADCKAIEVKPAFKAGDEVMAPWIGKYKKTKVAKVDAKFGRIYVIDPYNDKKNMILPFGTVTAPF